MPVEYYQQIPIVAIEQVSMNPLLAVGKRLNPELEALIKAGELPQDSLEEIYASRKEHSKSVNYYMIIWIVATILLALPLIAMGVAVQLWKIGSLHDSYMEGIMLPLFAVAMIMLVIFCLCGFTLGREWMQRWRIYRKLRTAIQQGYPGFLERQDIAAELDGNQ